MRLPCRRSQVQVPGKVDTKCGGKEPNYVSFRGAVKRQRFRKLNTHDAKPRTTQQHLLTVLRRGGKSEGVRIWVKPQTPTLPIDALIGKEEQEGEKERERRKQGAGIQHSYLGPFRFLLRPAGTIH